MMKIDTLKILFVINPASGAKSKRDWETETRDYFKPLAHIIEFYLLTGKDDVVSLLYWIDTYKPDRVIAVGGDGTVSLVAELLLDSPIAMGILPAGSANGMAKELAIPVTVEGAMDVILNGEVKCTDLIRINDKHICLHLSDVGVNAQLVKYFEEGDLRGLLGYAKLVLKVLVNKQKMHVTIKTDKEEIRSHAFMVVLANASKYGTGALINPDGNLHDGLFELVVVRKLAFWSVVKMFLQFKTFNAEKVEVFQAKSATIKTTKKMHFQVDGEYLGKVNRIDATILHARLNLLLPAKADPVAADVQA